MFLKISLLVILSTGVYLSNKIQLNEDPINNALVKVEKLFDLGSKDNEGYYQGTSASHTKSGRFVVLDRGNKKVHVFSRGGEEILVFGKEGNGPGELSRPFRVFASDSRIFVRQDMKISIFNFQGKHIKDASIISSGSTGFPIIHKGKILLTFRGNTRDKMVILDENGNVENRVENTEYIAPEAGEDDGMRVMITPNFKLLSANNGFYRANSGEYSFDYLDQNFNLKTTFTKLFSRAKRDFSRFKINIDDDSMTKEQLARETAKAMQSMKSRLGEYQDDVSAILGFEKGKLFLATASDDPSSLRMHVIEGNQFLSDLTVKVDGEVDETRIENGVLLINYKHPENGPIISAYSIK